jgi:branched-chain amino acid transport system substrate-binding protein
MVNFLTTMNKIHKRKATKIAVVYENSDWGQSITMGFKKHLANTDLRIVLDEPYPAKMPDLTPIVTKIKNVAPDVIIRSQYVSDAIMFTKSLAEMKVDVIGIIGPGGGETDPTFIPAVGEFGEYHLANPTYTPTMPYTRTWLKPINDGFKARYGRDITTVAVHGIINLYLLKDALERAKSTDPQKIRDALAATDIKSYNNPWFLYPMEGIKFDKEGQNIYSVPVMSQILGGELYPVWPKEYQFKEKALVWPMPTWAERKKK